LKKELKRQIKQDELVTGLSTAATWTRQHAQSVKMALVAIAVAAVGIGAFSFLRNRRAAEAEKLLNEALETFNGHVATELPEGFERPPGPVFPSAEEKYRKAATAFDGIERRYGSLPAGRRARYMAALCRIELGDTQAAEKSLGELAASKDEGLEPALARLALADLKRRAGRTDEAADAYRQIAEDRSFPLPRDQALMNLAAMLEEAQRVDEARASYKRLSDDFPSSVFAAEARRRAEYLDAGSSS
jgi:tetratricopeptide (TPR) repeat protein